MSALFPWKWILCHHEKLIIAEEIQCKPTTSLDGNCCVQRWNAKDMFEEAFLQTKYVCAFNAVNYAVINMIAIRICGINHRNVMREAAESKVN